MMRLPTNKITIRYEKVPHPGYVSTPQRWRKTWIVDTKVKDYSAGLNWHDRSIELGNWLAEHNIRYKRGNELKFYVNWSYWEYVFYNEDDALLFKLTWSE